MRAFHAGMLFAGMALAALLTSGTAGAAPALLDGFDYDAPRAEIEARPGAQKGEEKFAEDLFFKGVQWAGFAWTAQCSFAGGKLKGVTLYSAWSRELLGHVSAYLKERKFQMLGMILDDTALDIISLAKLGGREAFQKRFRELTSAKTPQRISYEWFDRQKIPQEQFSDAASLGQLLTLVPEDTLQVDVTQSASLNEGKLENRMLSIQFSYPVMDVLQAK